MRVSVIIVNYNTCDLLRDCLASIPVGFPSEMPEVVVVDNHSRDDSVAMVRAEFPEVKLVVNDRNRGFARANNLGAREASGEYLFFFNSDARFTPGSGEAMIAFMDAHPDAGMASPQLRYPDGAPQHTAAGQPTVQGEFLPRYVLRLFRPDVYYARDYGAGRAEVAVPGVVGAALLVRFAAARQVGFYDESFFFFFEETDWCRRMTRAGWKIYVVPGVDVIHLQGGTAKQVPIPVRLEYWRSRYTYFRRHFSPTACDWLYVVLQIKNLVNLLLNLPLAPFSSRHAYKARLAATIVLWHLRGRPLGMGISVRPA